MAGLAEQPPHALLVQHDRLLAHHLLKLATKACKQLHVFITDSGNLRWWRHMLGSFECRLQGLALGNQHRVQFCEKFKKLSFSFSQEWFECPLPLPKFFFVLCNINFLPPPLFDANNLPCKFVQLLIASMCLR